MSAREHGPDCREGCICGEPVPAWLLVMLVVVSLCFITVLAVAVATWRGA